MELVDKDMLVPVCCMHCGKVYDLAATETVARYADATVFTTPCCGRLADDRTWKSLPDFQKIAPDASVRDNRGNLIGYRILK
jgi:hypothetical protein